MSQGTYKLTEVTRGRSYSDKYGEKVVWLVALENAQAETPSGRFELHKKVGNEPKPGDSIEVERFFNGDFNGEPFVRIKQAYSGQQSAGGSNTSAGDKNFDRRPEHPRNEARMIHTSALSAAPAYYELLRTEGVIPKAEDKASALNTLVGIARWLADSYQQALAATEPAPQSASTNGGEVPADTAGLTPAPAGVPDDVPF